MSIEEEAGIDYTEFFSLSSALSKLASVVSPLQDKDKRNQECEAEVEAWKAKDEVGNSLGVGDRAINANNVSSLASSGATEMTVEMTRTMGAGTTFLRWSGPGRSVRTAVITDADGGAVEEIIVTDVLSHLE